MPSGRAGGRGRDSVQHVISNGRVEGGEGGARYEYDDDDG